MKKNNKLSLILLSCLGALFLLFGLLPVAMSFFGDTDNNSESSSVEATLASPVQGSDYRNLTLNPGANVSEMRFTWHSGHENSALVIVNPDGKDWKLDSVGHPARAHGGVGVMGADTNLLSTRTGYTYYVHQVAVYNLAPEQRYTYFIEWNEGRTADKNFRTGGSDSFQFIIAGDPQIGAGEGLDAIHTPESAIDGARWRQTLDIATEAFPDSEFILTLGDQVQSSNSNTTNPNKHVEISQFRYDEMFSSDHLHQLPLLAVVGNHDGWTFDNNNANIRLWSMHYNIPAPDEAKTRGGVNENIFRHRDEMYTQFDYWVRWGDVLFFVLDANGQNDGIHRVMTGERLRFLEDAIAQNEDATWRVATWHHPAYSVYRMTHIDEIQQIINNFLPHFERLNFDIILNGHAHVYSRSHHMLGNEIQHEQRFLDANANIVEHETNAVLNPTGVTHIDFNSASGSGFYNVAAMPRPYITTYNQNFQRNISVADVTPDTFSVRTYQINDDESRSLVDVYTIVHADENDDVPESVTNLPQLNDQMFERITQPDGVTVPNGTKATPEAFGLPETVGIETNLFNNVSGNVGNVRPPTAQSAPHSYGSVVRTPRAEVTWNIEGSDFDPDKEISQTFYVRGTVDDLPTGVINPENLPLYVDVEVTVLPAGIVLPGDIARWMQYPPAHPNHAKGMEAYFTAQGGINARVPAIEPTYGDATHLQFFVGDTARYFHWNAGAPTVTNATGTGAGGLDNLTEPAFWHTSFSTTGRAGIQVEFNFRSDPGGTGFTNNGPRDWQLEFSFDNEAWLSAGIPITLTGVWNNNIVRNLPDIADDREIVYLRWRLVSDIAVGGGAISPTARNHMRDIRIRSTRVLGEEEVACAGYQCIDVLMFNDFHGHIEAAAPVPENPGAARLTAFIQYQRYQNPQPSNVIVVSGGDDFHGYSVSTMTDGNPGLALMGYLAENSPAQEESGIHIALGNHEFSFGATRAREIGLHPSVSLLAADLYNADGVPGKRPDFILPYDIVEFPEHDITIALVGLMTSNMQRSVSGWGTLGLEARTPAPNNPSEYTQEIAELIDYLRNDQGVGAVIGLTHMGGNHESTTYIAQNLDFDGIVGGHIHTRVHRRVNGTPIIEAAHAGRALGRFRLVFDEKGELQGEVESWLSDAGAIENFTRPIAVMSGVGQYYDEMTDLMQPFFDETHDELRGPRGPHGVYFSNRAERDVWVSRLVVNYVERWAYANGEPTDWIGISNGGGWRNTGFWPRNADDPTTKAELISTMPFDNNILLFTMHGQDVLSLLNAPRLVGTQVRSGVHQKGKNWYVTATGERILNDRTQTFNVIGSNFIFGGIGVSGGDNYPWPGNTGGNQMGMEVLDPDGPRVLMIDGSTMSWNELQELSTAPADWVGIGVSMLRDALLDSSAFRRDTPNAQWQAALTVSAGTGGTAVITSPFAPGNRTRNTNIIPQWVTVTATPADGYDFVGWFDSSEPDATLLFEEPVYGFTIREDTVLEARFVALEPEPSGPMTIAAWANANLNASHGYDAITGANSLNLRWDSNYGLVASPGYAWLNFVDHAGSRTLAFGSGGINVGNRLAQNHYWLTEISTINKKDIQIEWNFRSTGTGPRDFQLQYQLGNGPWLDVGDPIAMPNLPNPSNINVAPHFTRTLPVSAENEESVQLRWVITSNTAVNGSMIASSGTHQIGNIRISGMVADESVSLPLTVEEVRAVSTGETVTARGVVTTNYAPGTAGNAFFLQNPTGHTPESGILVRVNGASATQLAAFAGHEVEVTGVRNGNISGSGFIGLENITVANLANIDIIGPATIPEPVSVTFDQLRDGKFQSMLVNVVEPVTIADKTTGATRDPNRVVNVPSGGNFIIWPDPAADKFNVDDQIVINRAAIHWWDARNEIQFRLIDPENDLTLYETEPEPITFTLELERSPQSGSETNPTRSGEGALAEGETAKLTAATPNAGYHFVRFDVIGEGSTITNLDVDTKTATFTMGTEKATVTAVYETEPDPITFTLELERSPHTGSVTDPTRSVKGALAKGETAKLTAGAPNAGYHFVRFDVLGEGSTITNLDVDERTATFTMGTADAIVTAVYVIDENFRGVLQDLLDHISTHHVEADYTAKSWDALQNAIAAAKVVLAAEDATKDQVLDAIQTLKTARDNLKVVDAPKSIPVAGIKINEDDFSLLVGKTQSLTTSITPDGATNREVEWTSNNSSIATVDANGRVTGVEAGVALISVSTVDGGHTASVTVTIEVPPTAITGITIDQSDFNLLVGEVRDLTVAIAPEDATNQAITWTSSDESRATVDADGRVTGVAAGTAVISVSTADGGHTASVTVTIEVPPTAITGITIDQSDFNLLVGEVRDLTVTIAPEGATNQAVTWTSSETSKATVDADGRVTGVATGTAVITATTVDGGHTASVTVTVESPPTTPSPLTPSTSKRTLPQTGTIAGSIALGGIVLASSGLALAKKKNQDRQSNLTKE